MLKRFNSGVQIEKYLERFFLSTSTNKNICCLLSPEKGVILMSGFFQLCIAGDVRSIFLNNEQQ